MFWSPARGRDLGYSLGLSQSGGISLEKGCSPTWVEARKGLGPSSSEGQRQGQGPAPEKGGDRS